MYKIMIRLMMHDTWNYIRQKKVYFFFYLLGAGFILLQCVQIILSENGGQMTFLKGMTGIICSQIVAFVLLWPLIQGVPLRVCKGVYVCPAGDKEKIRYLEVLTFVKVGIGFVVVLLVQLLFHGIKALSEHRWFFLISMILAFFTILSMSLNIGIGESGERKLDTQGYAVKTKTEMIIKIYWMCGIALQWMFLWFISLAKGIVPFDARFIGGVWLVFLAVNSFIAIKYVGRFLQEIISYEDVYCQRPQRYVAQYEI